jgi:hypothetical protein
MRLYYTGIVLVLLLGDRTYFLMPRYEGVEPHSRFVIKGRSITNQTQRLRLRNAHENDLSNVKVYILSSGL